TRLAGSGHDVRRAHEGAHEEVRQGGHRRPPLRLLRLHHRPLRRHRQQRRRRRHLPQDRHLPQRRRRRRRGRRDPHPFRRRPRGGAAAQPDAGARGVQRRRARPRPHVQQGAASRQGPRHPRAHAARRQVPRALEARQDLSSCSLFWENDAYSPSRTACSECNAVNYSMLQFGAV
ncbi:Os09g0541600, partial [Oryza sativa Japonica Group]